MMNIEIYQINMDRDENRKAFQSIDSLERFFGSAEIESAIYDKAFAGEVNCKDLEDVYQMFNLDRPKDYRGRSLSVSDVVAVIDADGKPTYHFCDSIGFKEVDFAPELTQELKEKKISVNGKIVSIPYQPQKEQDKGDIVL